MERHPVEAGVPKDSPVSPSRFVIYTTGLIIWVEEYIPSEGLSFVEHLGWVVTGSDVNLVGTTLERHAAKSIAWASRRGLQFDTPEMQAALCTCRQGHMKHLRPKLTVKIMVGNGFIQFNKQATCWLGVCMDAYLTYKVHHNRCMKKSRAAEARLRTVTKKSGAVPEIVSAVQIACAQAVVLYRSKLWWDPKEVGRRDHLQILLNRQAMSVPGALPITPRGALMRESELTPAPVILDSRHQQFAARLANACSSKLKEVDEDPSSGTPIC